MLDVHMNNHMDIPAYPSYIIQQYIHVHIQQYMHVHIQQYIHVNIQYYIHVHTQLYPTGYPIFIQCVIKGDIEWHIIFMQLDIQLDK